MHKIGQICVTIFVGVTKDLWCNTLSYFVDRFADHTNKTSDLTLQHCDSQPTEAQPVLQCVAHRR